MLNYPHELINLLNSLGNIGNRVVKPGPAQTGVRNGDDRCTGRKPGRFCEFAYAPPLPDGKRHRGPYFVF